jgi:hypothetical protein
VGHVAEGDYAHDDGRHRIHRIAFPAHLLCTGHTLQRQGRCRYAHNAKKKKWGKVLCILMDAVFYKPEKAKQICDCHIIPNVIYKILE